MKTITAISSSSAYCPKCDYLMALHCEKQGGQRRDYLKCNCSESRYKPIIVELEEI
jgi:hypothetical protein